MLEIQRYLRNQPKDKAFDNLLAEFAIKAKFHPTYPNIVQLHYDQLDSQKGETIVKECRGIILDINQDYDVVSFPYQRFFNFGEFYAVDIDWASAKIFEKTDGSLMSLFYYDGKWHVASKQIPNAGGTTPTEQHTFAELFWLVFHELGYQLPKEDDIYAQNHCFMFELMTEENRVIVPVAKNKLLLHGARNLVTLQEVDPKIISHEYGWQLVPEFKFDSLDAVAKAALDISPLDGEGFVVVDKNFNRVKIKSPRYVALSQLGGDGFSDKRLLTLCQSNESDEVLAYFPLYKERFLELKALYEQAVKETEDIYNATDLNWDRKEIAKEFQKSKWNAVLFARLDFHISRVRQGFEEMRVESLEKTLFGKKKQKKEKVR